MRIAGCSATVLLFAGPALFAQQPVAAPPLNPGVPDALPQLLQQWEQQMKAIRAIDANVVRTQIDAVTNDKRVYQGTAKLLRPDRADLNLISKDNPQVYERFLLTGNFLYEFQPKSKLVRVHQLPQKGPGQLATDDNFLGLMFGMSAQEVQRRYDLRLVKTDANYHYILIKSKLPQDRQEFVEARLVLWQQTFLPRQIEFVDPTGNPTKWEIQSMNTNPRLGPADFQKPQLPRDWNFKMEPPPGATAGPGTPGGPPPSKVRQSGGQ
jgi:TIGR03009 family protein